MKVSNNFEVGSFYTMELQAGVGSGDIYVCTKILVDSFGMGVGGCTFWSGVPTLSPKVT